MRQVLRSEGFRRVLSALAVAALALGMPAAANAQSSALEELVSAVVKIRTLLLD